MESLIALAGLLVLAFFVGPWIWLFALRGRFEGLELTVRRLDAQASALAKLVAELRRPIAEQRPGEPSAALLAPAAPAAAHTAVEPAAAGAPRATVSAPAIPARAPVASPAPTAPLKPAAPPKPQVPLEERIAFWFTRVGAAAFLLGVAYFFKYAVDSEWIGPLGRVALGALVGLAALAIAEVLWHRALTTYTQVVEGVGLCVLTASAYASVALYHLVPAPAAFVAIAIIALLGGALATYHKTEPVLLLSLLGALLAPVLLSTGQDNPLGLFGYLLLVGGLACWVALRERFAYTPFLAIAGSVLLFLGWYQRFFDPGLNGAIARAYQHLADRAVPGAAVAGFTAEWLLLGFAARRQKQEALRPLWLSLAGLIFAHAGVAALLFDQPLSLGVCFVALAALSTFVLRAEKRDELRVAPLAVSFAILALRAHDLANAASLPVLLVMALWAGLYASAFLRGRVRLGADGLGPLPVRSAALAAGCVAALGILGALVLFDGHPLGFAVLMAVLSLPLLLLSALALAPVLALLAAVGAFTGLSSVALAQPESAADLRLLWVAAAWAAIYLAGGSWDLFVRKLPATPLRLSVLSGAGLGFVALVIQQTPDAQDLLRSALLALVGAIDLAIGLALLRSQANRSAASLLLAQALGLFFAATALLLSGVSITVAWAAMAATCAVLAARAKDRQWLGGAAVLFGVTLLRLLSVDWQIPDHLRETFLLSQGTNGQLLPRVALNPRAYALLAVAVALGVAGRQLARVPLATFRNAAGAFVTGAHGLFLLLILSEARWAYLTLPAPPVPPFEPHAWDEYRAFVEIALQHQANGVSVLITLILGVYSLALLGIGFGARDALHRYLGLALFGLTLGKLGLYDVWHLPRIYQISTLVAVGVLLLTASYLYANQRTAIAALLKGDSAKSVSLPVGGGGGTALILLSLLAAGRAQALSQPQPPGDGRIDSSAFQATAAIEGILGPDLYRAPINPDLWRASQEPALQDLRLLDPAGNELPFFVREVPQPLALHTPRLVQMIDPVQLPGGGFRATFDVGQIGLKHAGLGLVITGSDFLRTVLIESSTDEAHFGVLRQGALVYRIRSGSGQSEQLDVTYPTSDARYLRVTLQPRADGQQVALDGATLTPPAVPSENPERWLPATLGPRSHDPERHTTRFELDLGAPGLPLTAVRFSIATPAFERRVELEALDGNQWVSIGTGIVFRATGTQGLQLPIDTDRAHLRVTIEDGNDAPLELSAAEVRMVDDELVFRLPSPTAPPRLLVGNPHAQTPHYDLRDTVARTPAIPLARARIQALHPNPDFAPPPPPVAKVAWSDQHRFLLTALLGAVLATLGAWTFLLLRRSGGTPS